MLFTGLEINKYIFIHYQNNKLPDDIHTLPKQYLLLKLTKSSYANKPVSQYLLFVVIITLLILFVYLFI